jgi:excisionase family DNA binding protein
MDVERLYLRVEDVAGQLGLDASTVYKMCKAREIPSIKIGSKAVRIPAPALEAYLRGLERGATNVAPEAPQVEIVDLPTQLQERAEVFTAKAGMGVYEFAERWRSGQIEDTPENADLAIAALSLRRALDTAGLRGAVPA